MPFGSTNRSRFMPYGSTNAVARFLGRFLWFL